MLSKCVAKLFALHPKANAIETGIITILIVTALLSTLLAVRTPIADFYDALMGDVVVGSR